MAEVSNYIKKIHIEGLLGSKTFDWSLKEDVNILGGENGSGKSTVIKACYQLLRQGKLTDEVLLNTIGKMEITLSNGCKISLTLEPIYLAFDDDSPILLGDGTALLAEDSPKQTLKVTDKSGKPKDFQSVAKELDVDMVSTFEQKITDAIRMSQISSENKNGSIFLDWLIEQELNKRNKAFAGTFGRMVDVSTGRVATSAEYSSEIKQFMALYDHLKLFFEDYDVNVTNSLDFSKNGTSIRYQDLSMGEKELLYILLKVSNKKGKPCIVFMDEPDLGMHVSWKKVFVKVLHDMNPKMQLILTTHAPSMINGWFDNVKEVGELTKEEK